jgi:peptidoglycan/xylan/chitin deacetylase (PgdA/CDA1 family)
VFHVLSQVGQLDVDDYSVKLVQSFMTTQQMLDIQLNGHEIGGHAKTHADLPTLDSATLFDEVSNSRQDLLSLGALPMTTMAYPYGRYNATVQAEALTAGFVAGRSVDRGFNVKSTDLYALKVQQVDRTTTLTELQGWIQQAVTDKTWLILMYHQVDNDPTTIYGSSPTLLQEVVDYLNAQAVDVVTVQEGVALMQ